MGIQNNRENKAQTPSTGDGDVSLPSQLEKDLRAIGMNLTSAIRCEIREAFKADPDRISRELQILKATPGAWDNPAGAFLTIVVRDPDSTLRPKSATEVKHGTPDEDCPYCRGTGTPLVDGIWQHGEACRCCTDEAMTSVGEVRTQ